MLYEMIKINQPGETLEDTKLLVVLWDPELKQEKKVFVKYKNGDRNIDETIGEPFIPEEEVPIYIWREWKDSTSLK